LLLVVFCKIKTCTTKPNKNTRRTVIKRDSHESYVLSATWTAGGKGKIVLLAFRPKPAARSANTNHHFSYVHAMHFLAWNRTVF